MIPINQQSSMHATFMGKLSTGVTLMNWRHYMATVLLPMIQATGGCLCRPKR